MNKTLLIMLFLILFSSLFSACTVREELQFKAELRDLNLGFTVSEFPIACIVSHPELVTSMNITLIDQNDQIISAQTHNIDTITELTFVEVQGGTYTSSCIVCSDDDCRSSGNGTVLVSIKEEQIDDYVFDLPPSFILGTPIDKTYFLSEKPLLVSFSCLAKDDKGLTAVSLVSDISGLFSETFIQNPTKSSHLLVKDLVLEPGEYLWTCRATDTRAQTVVAPVRRFIIGPATPEILPNITGFDGATTDFSKLTKLTDVEGVVIEDTDFGKISFVDNISSLVGVDLSKGIIITKDSITVNSSLYPQLNVPAKLSFYDIQYDENLEDANIEKDGSTYTVDDLTYEDGTLSFTVGNFSTYNVVITPQGGYNLEDPDEKIELEVEKPTEEIIEEEEDLIDPLDEINGAVEEIVVEVNDTVEETPEEQEDITPEKVDSDKVDDIFNQTQEEIVSKGSKPFNPILLGGLIILFIFIVFLIVWFMKKRSENEILKRY